MTAETQQKIARCPHCGHDEFLVNQSEIKTIRLVGLDKPPYVREELVYPDSDSYDVVICDSCHRDLGAQELLDSVMPEEVC